MLWPRIYSWCRISFWQAKMNIDKLNHHFGIPSSSLISKWFISKFFAIPALAHHATCKCFNHHLIRIGSNSFCLGCSCLAIGVIFFMTLSIFTMVFAPLQIKKLNPWQVVSIGSIFTALTFIQPFFQKKWFKILSRTSLGFGISMLWFGAMGLLSYDNIGLILRGVFILIFTIMLKLSLIFRNHYTIKTTCKCGRNAYPYCPENQIRKEKLLNQYLKKSAKDDPMIPIIQAIAKSQQYNGLVSICDNLSTLTIEKNRS